MPSYPSIPEPPRPSLESIVAAVDRLAELLAAAGDDVQDAIDELIADYRHRGFPLFTAEDFLHNVRHALEPAAMAERARDDELEALAEHVGPMAAVAIVRAREAA